MAVSSGQKNQNKRKARSPFVLEFLGGGCRHWSEEIEKDSTDVEGQRDKQGWRRQRHVGGGVETEACSLIGNSGSDRQPVKMSEYWSDVNMSL